MDLQVFENLKEDNSLCLDEFDICPVYFSVKHNQVVDIYTTVTASHPGLYLSHAKVLCDNCTVEYLDFLAEALTFKSEWIEFNNMKKTFDIDIEDNIEAEFYIDLGEQLCTAIVPYTFFLYNSGGVNLNYHWEIKKANIPGTEGLTEDVLNIDQKSGIILAKNQHTTTICCNILSALPGRYRMLIVLIIDDLPRKCVEMKDSHFIIDESEENVVSLKVGVIEVWLECVRPCVVINPFSLDLSTELLQCGQMEFIEFEVSNESPGCVDISIQLPASSLHALLYCEPAVFDIDKLSSVKFILIIEPITSGFFTQILKCIVNSGEMVLDVLVKGKCSSGFLTSPEFCLDFGVVKKYYRPSKKIKVKSHYHNKVLWILQELEYSKNEILKVFDHKSQSVDAGYFCHKGCSVYGNYTFDESDTVGIHCSLLEWSVGDDNLYMQIIADVFTTDVSLDFISYTFDPLYMNVKVSLNITARNHSPVSTYVYWGHPLGNQHNLLINVEPKETLIPPEGKETFQLFVTPVVEGQLVDFYVPCFVEFQKYPLLLQINGKVKDLQVIFQWKAIKEHICVSWPQPSSETICTKIATCFSSWKDSFEVYPENESCSLETDENLQEIKETITSLVEEVSTPSSEKYLNWPIIGGKFTPSEMEESNLESDFKEPWIKECNIQDVKSIEDDAIDTQVNDYYNFHALTFLNVPPKQLVTQDVCIFNETEIECHFSCCAVQYKNICLLSSSESLITRIQKKVYDFPEADEHFLGTDKEKGLSITVEPTSGVLPAQGSTKLKVTVYTLAWGDYNDTIQIRVGCLPMFPLAVHVSCDDHGVSITQPKLRFGTSTYLATDYKSQMLRVYNNSCLPIFISWQMFVDLPFKSNPFSIILADDFKSDTPFGLHLVPYVGVYCNDIFKMMEPYTTVEPWCTKAVEIKFNPRNPYVDVDGDNLLTSFTGNIIGHVFTDQSINGSNRKMGIELQPLEAFVEASVQVPAISFLNVDNFYLIFKCKAWEVMELANKTMVMENIVMLGNDSQVHLEVTLSVSKPFHISSICYQRMKCKDEFLEKISLSPRETCEMTITCKVTEQTMDKIFAEFSTEKVEDGIKAAVIKEGKMTFSQPALTQELNLELRVYQPILTISPSYLPFGPVLVNQTKYKLLYIKSTTETQYAITMC